MRRHLSNKDLEICQKVNLDWWKNNRKFSTKKTYIAKKEVKQTSFLVIISCADYEKYNYCNIWIISLGGNMLLIFCLSADVARYNLFVPKSHLKVLGFGYRTKFWNRFGQNSDLFVTNILYFSQKKRTAPVT